MNIFKLTILFIMILFSNFALIKVDFGKILKKNSTIEIKIFVSIVSLALGYVSYMTILTIYELSLNLFK